MTVERVPDVSLPAVHAATIISVAARLLFARLGDFRSFDYAFAEREPAHRVELHAEK